MRPYKRATDNYIENPLINEFTLPGLGVLGLHFIKDIMLTYLLLMADLIIDSGLHST